MVKRKIKGVELLMETRLEAYYRTHVEEFEDADNIEAIIGKVYEESGWYVRQDHMVSDLAIFLQRTQTYKKLGIKRVFYNIKKFIENTKYQIELWYRGRTVKPENYIKKAEVKSFASGWVR